MSGTGFVGGALKLKGGAPLKSAGGVKKAKKKGSSSALVQAESAEKQTKAEAEKDLKEITRGYEIKQPDEDDDRRTDAEKRFEARQIQLEKDRLKKLAGKSHRDRVKDFNDYLANLSEHHDIPRVGPG